jgi:hypothetical protein
MLGRNIPQGGASLTGLTPAQPPKVSPTQAAGAGNAPAGAATPDPYDSQYYIDLAAATQRANDKIAGWNADITNAGTNLQTNQQTLARNLALQTTASQNQENARGGFGLGALGTRLGNISSANQARATALNTKYSQDLGNWNSAITAAQNGLSTETIALRLASADRKSKLVAASGGTLGTSGGSGSGSGSASGGSSAPAGSRPGPASAGKPTGASLTGLTAAKPPAPKVIMPKPVARNKIGYHGGF